MTTPGQRRTAKARARLEQLQFYVDSLTNIERSKLAARFLPRIPAEHRQYLLRRKTVAELAFSQVFAQETYGW